ncbi:MAG: TRAP transporter small permease [Clostridiales Family XIII bacterium]|jgi:TRAP-type C4-dicarboxylate transport system permease small subunit|nr:TRAP transporter small permease [Clostridiales Family XIII bacterium]
MIKLGKFMDRFSSIISLLSYAGVVAIMLVNVADILMNKLWHKPIFGATDITEQLLLCTVLASFAYGQSKKAHINMTMIIKHLPRVVKFPLFGLMGLLSTATAAFMGYAAILQVQNALAIDMKTEVLYMPKWPFYVVEVVCLFALALVLLYDTIMAFAATGNKKIEEAVVSTWND